jgi:hypothetical protein
LTNNSLHLFWVFNTSSRVSAPRTSAHAHGRDNPEAQHNTQPVINTNTTTSTTERSSHIMSTMFGALNRFISRLDAAPQEQQQSGVGGAYGFQVLKNANQEIPLEPWFDFVIGINGRTIVSAWVYGVEDCQSDTVYRITLIRRCSQQKCATVQATPLAWVYSAQR